MTDEVARLGLRVESQSVTKAADELGKLAAASKQAEAATAGVGKAGDAAASGLKKAASEADKAAGSTKSATNAVRNLSFQINDIGTSLASGASPFQVLAQQGGQVFQVWQQSPTVFRDTGRAIASVMSPLRLFSAGVIATGVSALVMAENFKAGQREVERSLSGTGRASGLTIAGINAIADAESRRARISVASARDIASAYAGAGFGGASTTALTSITKDFAAQTGLSIDEAKKKLIGIFDDPVRGAMEMQKLVGGIDAKTADYIRTLSDQNNKEAARLALIDATGKSVAGASENVSWYARAWQSVSAAASNAVERVGKALSQAESPADQIARLSADRGRALRAGKTNRAGALGDEISTLQEQIRLEGRLQAQRTETARAASLSLRADELARGLDPASEKLKQLNAEAKVLSDTLQSATGRNALPEVSLVERALEARRNAIATNLTAEQRITAEAELQARAMLARTAQEQLSVNLDRERLAMSGQIVDAKEREARLQRQIVDAQAQAARVAQDALRSANDNLALSGLLPYERAMKQIEIDSRKLREQTSLTPAPSIGASMANRVFVGAVPGAAPATGIDQAFASKVRALIQAVDDPGARMTSGFRSYEKQQELYDRYGPGRAARPGSSQHEHGTAMDYVFSSAAARARALELAPQYGIRGLPSNGGAVHFDAGRGGARSAALPAATAAINADTQARVANSVAAQRQALQLEQVELPLRQSKIELDQQRAALALQEQGMGLSARAMATAQKEQELLNRFQSQGIPITDKLRESIRSLAAGYGEVATASQTLKLRQDLNFERDQILRSPGEQQDAARLRGVFGEGYKSELDGPEAAQMRFNRSLQSGVQLAGDFFTQILQGAAQGRKGIDFARSALASLGSQLASMAGNSIARSLFGGLLGGTALSGGGFFSNLLGGGGIGGAGLFSGLTGTGGLFATGGVFSGGNVVPFAKGGAFTNSIVSQPTIFPFAKGGSFGVMGEAGPEAIMPLKRGSDGSLGVQMSGGGATQITMGDTHINISGNADSAAIAQMRREMAQRDREFARNVAAANSRANVRKVR